MHEAFSPSATYVLAALAALAPGLFIVAYSMLSFYTYTYTHTEVWLISLLLSRHRIYPGGECSDREISSYLSTVGTAAGIKLRGIRGQHAPKTKQ